MHIHRSTARTQPQEAVLCQGRHGDQGQEKFRAIASRLRDLVIPEPEPSIMREPNQRREAASSPKNVATEEPLPATAQEQLTSGQQRDEPMQRSVLQGTQGPEPSVIGRRGDSGEFGPQGTDRAAHAAPKILQHVTVEMKPVWFSGETDCGETSSKNSPLSSEPTSSRSPIVTKDFQSLRRLWCVLVLLSFLELCLVSGGILVDRWSPCREVVSPCTNLHDRDCLGWSCRDCVPLWASAWPAASLVFVAMPMRCLLGGRKSNASCSVIIPFFVLVSLAVLGAGAAVLAESVTSGMHYAARCPMQRENSRCTAELCPTPPCRRESDFSPCVCGLLREAELARALFLHNAPACQPYEWYAWQMGLLEDIVLRYEAFACLAGPLTCTATAVGGALLLVQLACCPVVLIGQWGGNDAVLLLLGRLDTQDTQFTRVANPELKHSPPVLESRIGYVKACSEDSC